MPIVAKATRPKTVKFPATVLRTRDAFIVQDDQTSQRFTVPVEMVSDYVKDAFPVSETPIKNVFIRASEGVNKIFGMSPYAGTFYAVFNNIGAKKGESPTPEYVNARTVNLRSGGSFVDGAHYEFKAWLELIGDTPFAGVTMPYYLRYMFTPGVNDTILFEGSQRFVTQFTEFMEAVGSPISEIDIHYSDNMLPALESIIQANSKVILLHIENGYIRSVSEPEVGIELPEVKPALKAGDLDEQKLDDIFKGI